MKTHFCWFSQAPNKARLGGAMLLSKIYCVNMERPNNFYSVNREIGCTGQLVGMLFAFGCIIIVIIVQLVRSFISWNTRKNISFQCYLWLTVEIHKVCEMWVLCSGTVAEFYRRLTTVLIVLLLCFKTVHGMLLILNHSSVNYVLYTM